MTPKLNIGMIGAGFIGQLAHLMNYVEIDRCRVLALAEYRPELRRRVALRYEIPRTYATHHELLQDSDIEAVVVVTPRPYTAPVVLDCIQAGKHVLSEKPMAGNSAQGQKLVEAAQARNVLYAVGYMKRYDEGVQTAKRLLEQTLTSGELGEVLFVRTHCFMGNSYCNASGHVITEEKPSYENAGWPTAPEWLPDPMQKPFATYLNTYSHNTNLLRYLFGQTPKVEYACLDPRKGQIAILNFGNFMATVETGRASNQGWDEVTEVFFTDGRLTIRTPPALLKNVPASVELYRGGTIQQLVSPQCNWTWAFRRQAEGFVSGALDGSGTLSPGADALEDMRLIEAMWTADQVRSNQANPAPETRIV
jgi:predicted dehydrogenase